MLCIHQSILIIDVKIEEPSEQQTPETRPEEADYTRTGLGNNIGIQRSSSALDFQWEGSLCQLQIIYVTGWKITQPSTMCFFVIVFI